MASHQQQITVPAGMNILNLENKTRQQPKIAHEQGAGSQCNRCGPKCSGFDLHFWRKICRNCRCGKENHAVPDDEDPSNRVGRLLEGPSQQNSKNYSGQSKTTGNNGSRPSGLKLTIGLNGKDGGPKSPLDWVPPGADSQLAVKYIEQLPVAQQPITGSQAAADRKRALDRQLPSHDLDPDQCQSMSANEKQKMEEYVKNVKEFVVGQGLIQEIPVGKLPPPPPQLDRILVEKVSHLGLQQHNSKVGTSPSADAAATGSYKPVARPLPQFITAKPFGKASGANPPEQNKQYVEPDLSDLPPPPPELLMDLPNNKTAEADNGLASESKDKKPQDPVRDFFDFLDEQEGKKLPGRLRSPFLHQQAASGNFNSTAKPFGSPTSSRSAGSSSGSPNLGRAGTYQGRLVQTTDFDAPVVPSVPPPPPPTQQPIKKTSINNNIEPPKIQSNNNSIQETGSQQTKPKNYIATYDHEVIQEPEQVWTCRKCAQPIVAGTVAIFAERAGSDKCWHPQCFTCSICNEMLADLIYFYVDGSVFCGRDYAEKMKIPRCKACDELIFAPEYTSAEKASWHTNHFCCFLCDSPLAGQQYTPVEGQPHCLDCYQKKYGKDCYECGKSIRADETRVSHGEMHWHSTGSCFCCKTCRISMVNRQFILKNGHIFCSRDCVISQTK